MTQIKAVKVENNIVTHAIRANSNNIPNGFIEAPDDVGISYTYDGQNFYAPEPETPPVTIHGLRCCLEVVLNSKAAEFGYPSILDAVSYANEATVPQYQTEGQNLRAWRSSVRQTALQIIADVEAEVRAMPTMAEFMAELPAFNP